MSKWFVGSSKTRMCGFAKNKAAKARRAFCPPENLDRITLLDIHLAVCDHGDVSNASGSVDSNE